MYYVHRYIDGSSPNMATFVVLRHPFTILVTDLSIYQWCFFNDFNLYIWIWGASQLFPGNKWIVFQGCQMKVETGLPLYMSCIRLKLRGEGVVTLCYNMTSKGIAPSKLSFVDPPPLKVYLCSFYKFEANSERCPWIHEKKKLSSIKSVETSYDVVFKNIQKT